MFARAHRAGRSTGSGRIYLTLQRGERIHCLGLSRALFWLGAALVPGSLVIAALSVTALFYRDDLISGLVTHERAIVDGYEQAIAQDRAAFDAASDRSRRERETLDERLRDLAARQATLEARTAQVAALGSRLGGGDVTGSISTVGRGEADAAPTSNAPGALSRLLRFGAPKDAPQPAPLPAEASAYAAAPGARPAKPRPSALDISPADDAALPKRPERHSSLAPEDLRRSLDRLETTQEATVAALAASARHRVGTYEAVFARLGLDANRLRLPDATASHPNGQVGQNVPGGQGGPLVPVTLREGVGGDLAGLSADVDRAERLARLAARMPLAAPAEGPLEMTSPFGVRTDPFTGASAMHTGLDLREEPGAPIFATASGRVTAAEQAGGYGNMVEIDHGNGIRTRYGHLSSILVHEDQWVEAGATIGRAGSTGRSTGTHLHYEVRVEGEAVDPTRFLEAGAKLADAKL